MNNKFFFDIKKVLIITFFTLFLVSTPNIYALSGSNPLNFHMNSFCENNFSNNYNKKNIVETISSENKYIITNTEYSMPVENVFCRDNEKIAFLTFDDGPTYSITPKILDVLKTYNVKATFFVIGSLAQQNTNIIRREVQEGHSIGNHTYSHDYKKIYSSSKSFIDEIEECDKCISRIVGNNYHSRLVRFPGGTFGMNSTPYNKKLEEKNYVFIDWNAANGDAEYLNVPKEKLIKNVKDSVQGKNHVVILMHDAATKQTTVDALPEIIEYLKDEGYEFKALR